MKWFGLNFSALRNTTLAALALSGFFLLAGTPARAADRDDCYRRVHYTQYRYREAVENHGPYSRQARHWAHERHEAREHCYYRDWR